MIIRQKTKRVQGRTDDIVLNGLYAGDQRGARAILDVLAPWSENLSRTVIAYFTRLFTRTQWSHTVYLLRIMRTDRNYTYTGSTNNFAKRLRQHNGEIVGGAKTTTRKTDGHRFEVHPICTIRGFNTISQARSFEYKSKHVKFSDAASHRPVWQSIRRANGTLIHPQVRKLLTVCSLERWSRKCPPAGTVPLVVQWYSNFRTEMPALGPSGEVLHLPPYVEQCITDPIPVVGAKPTRTPRKRKAAGID